MVEAYRDYGALIRDNYCDHFNKNSPLKRGIF